MQISPIMGTSSLNHQSNSAFKGYKKNTHETANNGIADISKKTILPASMFIVSLSPSMLDATVTRTEPLSLPYSIMQLAGIEVSKDLPYYLQDENLRYAESFEMGGKDYTIYYSDSKKDTAEDENRVLDIYIAPDDFELVTKKGKAINSPMKVNELVYHRDENFIGVIVSEKTCDKNGQNKKTIVKEIKLPDYIGEDLLDLYFGKSEYYLCPNRIQFSETNSSELQKRCIIRE